jgi:hypothetical protein
MKCWQCGTENPVGSVYCCKCGVELSKVAVKPQVKTKPQTSHMRTIPPPGMCFYHRDIPSQFICAKCGRSICKNCVERVGGLIFCVMCAPLKERGEGWKFAAYLLILVGFLNVFFVFVRFYYGLFDEWTVYDVVCALVFVLCGWQLLRGKKWAGLGGILFSIIDFSVVSYYIIYPFIILERYINPFLILILIMWILEIVIIILIVKDYSKVR